MIQPIIEHDRQIGDRRSIHVTMDDRGVTFIGSSTPGYPGPVEVWIAGWREEFQVIDPLRYGDTFGPDWVRAYFA